MRLTHHREILLESRIFHDGTILINAVAHRLTHRPQHIGRHAPASSGQHTVARFQMKIITTVIGFLSPCIDIPSDVGLIRRLVGRKTDIPVDAIRAVTRKDVRHTFIPWRKAGNHPCQQLLEVCLHTQIFRFMFLKPLPVVVCRQYFQEIQYARYIHILYF